MANAISYCEMRVLISGSPTCGDIRSGSASPSASSMSRRAFAINARRIIDVKNRIAFGAQAHAGVFRGQKACAPQGVDKGPAHRA